MARSQSKELHQGGRLPQSPGILGDGPRTYANLKASEQPYPYGLAVPTHRRLGAPHTLRSRRTYPLGVALPYALAHFPTRLELAPMNPATTAHLLQSGVV